MHDRNIFKDNKPNFEKLALEYKEFAPYVDKGTSGKSYVNFKDPASLRSLSLVLLKKYFSLSIDVPLDRLIPTIPLRLNYIHWVEDLIKNVSNTEVFGIDVGCGASCVYALLGNRMNKWKFITTEIDEYSEQFAQNNIKQNNMEDDIKIVKVSHDDPPLSVAINSSERESFDFCMCNPPFFSDVQDERTNRTDRRPPPDSVSTASECESFTQGGEVEFVKRIIDDSLIIKGKVKWYTSMMGRKSSLKPIIRYLKSNNISTYDTTMLVQGKTMRWGIAWSFTESVIEKVPNEKKSKPLFLAPSDTFYNENQIPTMNSSMCKGNISDILLKISEFISKELKQLQVFHEEPARILLQNKIAYEIIGKAYTNTWTHQRRKRRKNKNEESRGNDQHTTTVPSLTTDNEGCNIGTGENTNKRKVCDAEDDGFDNASRKRLCEEADVKSCSTTTKDEPECDIDSDTDSPLFYYSITIGQTIQLSVDNSDRIILSFLCLSGNRDIFYQMFTYFKNVLTGTQLQLKLFI